MNPDKGDTQSPNDAVEPRRTAPATASRQRHRRWLPQTFSEVAELLILIVTTAYLAATIGIWRATLNANEIARAAYVENGRETREMLRLNIRSLEVAEKSLGISAQGLEQTRTV